MPISSIDDCNETHWGEVLKILKESLLGTKFDAEIVSSADDTGVIQGRIVQSLFDDPIVICDVSAKNPNVMFELGLRLAFDKPTVIIKDDKTNYSFDTSVIEHIPYPRDLHFHKIVEFKEKLRMKVEGTYKRAQEDADYSCFLKHFVKYKPKEMSVVELPAAEVILKELSAIRADVNNLRQSARSFPTPAIFETDLCVHGDILAVKKLAEEIRSQFKVRLIRTIQRRDEVNHFHIQVSPDIKDELFRLNPIIAELNVKVDCVPH